MKPLCVFCVGATALFAAVHPLAAQTFGRDQTAFWSFYWENDTFYSTDQSYTNGARVQRIRTLNATKEHWWIPDRLLRRSFAPDCPTNPTLCWEWAGGWTIGQNFYTPQDIRATLIVPDDRPYGGWLYAGAVLVLSRPDLGAPPQLIPAMQHTFEIDIGITGEPSFAEDVQTFVHRYIATGAPEPEGWGNQIGTTAGVVLQYTGKTRAVEWNAFRRRIFDVLPEWNLAAGNIFTYAGGGATARLGWDLGDDFGTGRITPVAAMMGRQAPWEAYVFGGLNARAVAHNVFLDGRWFADEAQTVRREVVVSDAELGAFVRYRRIGLSFRWVRRTPEFKDRPIWQEYGAFNLTLLY